MNAMVKDTGDKTMGKAKVKQPLSPDMMRLAKLRAKDRAKSARWDLDVAAFFFAISIIVIILVYQGIGVEIIRPKAMVAIPSSGFIFEKG